jgi:hypothetical protein
VAPEARQDILDYRPTEPVALGLQAGTKNLVQASETVGGGVQHRERMEIDVSSSDTRMGLIPSSTSAVLASPAHAAIRWTPA